MSQHPHEEETVDRDGYQLTFYPGFLSRATLRGADGAERELFKQSKPYHLPQGEKKPKKKHRLRLKGGPRKQDVTFEVHDPELRIASITIELYEEDRPENGTTRSGAVETLRVFEDPVLCPPMCNTDRVE